MKTILLCAFLLGVASANPLIREKRQNVLPPDIVGQILTLAQPGTDYPALTEVPETSFRCAPEFGVLPNGGYYADIETGCQGFHVCAVGQMWSFLCPVQTLFNQRTRVCDWFWEVNCETAPAFYASSNAEIDFGPGFVGDDLALDDDNTTVSEDPASGDDTPVDDIAEDDVSLDEDITPIAGDGSSRSASTVVVTPADDSTAVVRMDDDGRVVVVIVRNEPEARQDEVGDEDQEEAADDGQEEAADESTDEGTEEPMLMMMTDDGDGEIQEDEVMEDAASFDELRALIAQHRINRNNAPLTEISHIDLLNQLGLLPPQEVPPTLSDETPEDTLDDGSADEVGAPEGRALMEPYMQGRAIGQQGIAPGMVPQARTFMRPEQSYMQPIEQQPPIAPEILQQGHNFPEVPVRRYEPRVQQQSTLLAIPFKREGTKNVKTILGRLCDRLREGQVSDISIAELNTEVGEQLTGEFLSSTARLSAPALRAGGKPNDMTTYLVRVPKYF